jgi:hypothetical protein
VLEFSDGVSDIEKKEADELRATYLLYTYRAFLILITIALIAIFVIMLPVLNKWKYK